ncbi:MAG: hypothetical protein ACK43N_05150 [Pirellulaceae bacterium]
MRAEGLHAASRQHVHLSQDVGTATRTGQRCRSLLEKTATTHGTEVQDQCKPKRSIHRTHLRTANSDRENGQPPATTPLGIPPSRVNETFCLHFLSDLSETSRPSLAGWCPPHQELASCECGKGLGLQRRDPDLF